MQFQKHFKSASPISLLLAQIVTSVFGFAVYFLFATPVTMYIAYTGREDAVLRTVVTTIGTVFAVMVGTASTPLLNLRFEKNGYLQKIRNTSKVLFIQTACTALFAWALYGADKDPKSNPFDLLLWLVCVSVSLSNVLAMLIQIAIYAILNHRKNRRAYSTAADTAHRTVKTKNSRPPQIMNRSSREFFLFKYSISAYFSKNPFSAA